MTLLIGQSSAPWDDLVKDLRSAKKYGFDYIEISMHEPMNMPALLLLRQKQILTAQKKQKMFLVVHAPWWAELGTPHNEVREGWLEASKNMIETTAALDSHKLNFHPYFKSYYKNKKLKTQILKHFTKSFTQLVTYGKKYNVEIVIENHGDKNLTVLDYKKLLSSVKGLGMNIDMGHAFVEGGQKRISDMIKTLAPYLAHIHMHDNHGKSDEHLAFGKGNIKFDRLVKELKKVNYNNTITLEIFAENWAQRKASLKKLKSLWNRE